MSKFIRPSVEDSTITEWVPPIIDENADFSENVQSDIEINSNFIDIDFTQKFTTGKTKIDNDVVQNRDRGYDDGYNIGKHEAESIFQSNIDENLLLLQNNINRLADPLIHAEQSVQKELAELAILIAEKMIADHIRHKPETIVNLVAEAVKLLPHKNKTLTVSIHSEDLLFIETHADVLEGFNCKFTVDDNLQRGGMLLHSDDVNIDLTLEKRMRDLIVQFFEGN